MAFRVVGLAGLALAAALAASAADAQQIPLANAPAWSGPADYVPGAVPTIEKRLFDSKGKLCPSGSKETTSPPRGKRSLWTMQLQFDTIDGCRTKASWDRIKRNLGRSTTYAASMNDPNAPQDEAAPAKPAGQ